MLSTERLNPIANGRTTSVDEATPEFAPSNPNSGRMARRDRAGEVLAGRYRLIERVGMGGMGSVYRAIHTTIRKSVAVKVLDGAHLGQAEFTGRFLREAQASSQLRHENIVDVNDFGETPDGSVFLVMEFLEGEDLATTLDREQTLPWPRVKRIILQVLSALACAHRHGILHRDIKLENCFRIRQNDNPDFIKVLDFGNAKLIDGPAVAQADFGDQARRAVTAMGVIVGTAAYISPEQAEQLPLDARSDLYSVGVMLFELLTGRLPFEAATFMGVLSKHIHESPPSPRAVCPQANIPLRVEALILRLLAKRPSERFASAEALSAAISSIPDEYDGSHPGWKARSEGPTLARSSLNNTRQLAPNHLLAPRSEVQPSAFPVNKQTVFARRPPLSRSNPELPAQPPQPPQPHYGTGQTNAPSVRVTPTGSENGPIVQPAAAPVSAFEHELALNHTALHRAAVNLTALVTAPPFDPPIGSTPIQVDEITDHQPVLARVREASGPLIDHQKLARLEAHLVELADTSLAPDDSLVAALERARPRRTRMFFGFVGALVLGSAGTLILSHQDSRNSFALPDESAVIAGRLGKVSAEADHLAAPAPAQVNPAVAPTHEAVAAIPAVAGPHAAADNPVVDASGEALTDSAEAQAGEPQLMIQFVGDTVVRQKGVRRTGRESEVGKSGARAEHKTEKSAQELRLPAPLVDAVQLCGRQHGAIPGDRLLLSFEVKSDGSVQDASAGGLKRASQDLQQCAVAALRKHTFSGFAGEHRKSVEL